MKIVCRFAGRGEWSDSDLIENLLAIGIMRGLQGRGLDGAEDFAIVDFADILFASDATPAQTITGQSQEYIGQRAAGNLLKAITFRAGSGGRRAKMPYEL